MWCVGNTAAGHPCTLPADPINGHKNCSEQEHAVHCTLACKDGYAFAFRPVGDYSCSSVGGAGAWQGGAGQDLPFPDCSVTALSSLLTIPANLRLSLVTERPQQPRQDLCDDSFFLKQELHFIYKSHK